MRANTDQDRAAARPGGGSSIEYAGLNAMGGFRRNKNKDGKSGDNAEPPRPPAPKPAPHPVDDLYDTGDIAAPTPDRDDEQRDL
jgi:hypothetical protein